MSARGRLACVLAGALTTSALAVSPAHAAGGFTGSWEATDIPDGSHMTLSISGTGARYAVQLHDESATAACQGAPATVTGPGRLDGATLLVDATLTCRPGGNVIRHRIALLFSYDTGSDTLEDGFGVTWYRA